MQKMASRFLRMSSDRIMTVAENLYNQGIISYPRTETDVFANSFQLQPLIERQRQDLHWGNYAQELLNGKFKTPRKGKHDDQAHPPIHPVRAAANLEGDEKKVFEFITRRFLACCSAAATGQETVVEAAIGSELFKSSGLTIIERNFLDVYPYEKWSNSIVAPFVQGEQIHPKKLEVKAGSTAKPQMLTEADLITLMDQSGIGTDATIHEHIKKILEREYSTKEGNYFYPTTLGMALVTGYDRMDINLSLSKPDLRAMMELNMKAICDGRKSKDDVVAQVCALYKQAFETASNQMMVMVNSCAELLQQVPADQQIRTERDRGVLIRSCRSCISSMYLKSIRTNETRKMVGCSGYPTCKECIWIPDVVSDISVSVLECPQCSVTARPVFKVQCISTDPVWNGLKCLWCDPDLLQPPIPSFNRPTQEGVSKSKENIPNCNCNELAISKIVRKEGPNQGRVFYSCSKQGGCNFFQWGDEPVVTISQPTNLSTNSLLTCSCGISAAVRTVKKEGPNVGKQFYSCSKNQSDTSRCDFFEWAENSNTNGGLNGAHSDMSDYRSALQPVQDNQRKCECNLVAAIRTSSKEESRGRQFYTCPKSASKCRFFEWLDQPTSSSNRASDMGNGVGVNSGAGNCYICGESGHFASNCPARVSSEGSRRGTRGGRGRGGRVSKRGRGKKPRNPMTMSLNS
jgi:DNA topoisomerase III